MPRCAPRKQARCPRDGSWSQSTLGTTPQLRLLCWSGPQVQFLDPEVAFGKYEAYWRFVEHNTLEPNEAALIQALADEFGNGLINA